MKNILLVGDLVGRGRLAITAQASVLTPKGYSVSYLPTALVSNNFGYKDYAICDTTAYMKETLDVWRRIGFHFDVISIGFLASDQQADILIEYCAEERKHGAQILVDPIMGDNGTLYSGLGTDVINRLKRLVAIADLSLPNYTESCYLSGIEYNPEGLDADSMQTLTEAVSGISDGSFLITSVKVDGVPSVIGIEKGIGTSTEPQASTIWTLPYREVPVFFSGTGDIFSAKLMSTLLRGKDLKAATQITIEKLSALIDTYQDAENKLEGLPY